MGKKGYKGFNKNLVCRNKKYEENTIFEENTAEICKCGMHFCENPFDVLDYYGFVNDNAELNEFTEVEALDECITNDNKKYSTKKIKIGAKLGISGLCRAFINFTFSKIDFKDSAATNTGDYSAATNTGDYSAATNTGNRSAATNTGYCSAATNTGNCSAATNTGDYSAATNTGDCSAATNTGDYSAATNTGNRSAATVNGINSFAIATGYQSKARGKLGCYIALAEWKYIGNALVLKDFKAHKVDNVKIKEDVFYMLIDGEFVETK